MTDIYYAAAKGDIKLLKELIAAGRVDLNARTLINPWNKENLCTPLELVAQFGRWRMVNLLHEKRAHIDNDSGTNTGLALAVLEMLSTLKKTDPNYSPDPAHNVPTKKPTMLVHSRSSHDILKHELIWTIQTLLKHGASANAKVSNSSLDPLLILVVQKNNVELVKLLCKHGADPNIRNKNNDTPLHTACRNRNIEVAIELVKNKNIDINLVNDEGETPLMLALMASPPDIPLVQAFLDHPKIDLNVQDEEGYTALHYSKNAAIARMLCEKGANVNTLNSQGFTPADHQLMQMTPPSSWDPELIKVHIEFGNKADLTRWERYFSPSIKPILEIPAKVTEFFQNLNFTEIEKASQDPDTGELFRKNFMARAAGELDIPKSREHYQLDPNLSKIEVIKSIEQDLIIKALKPSVTKHMSDQAKRNTPPLRKVPEHKKSNSTSFNMF